MTTEKELEAKWEIEFKSLYGDRSNQTLDMGDELTLDSRLENIRLVVWVEQMQAFKAARKLDTERIEEMSKELSSCSDIIEAQILGFNQLIKEKRQLESVVKEMGEALEENIKIESIHDAMRVNNLISQCFEKHKSLIKQIRQRQQGN